jgi:hypothetical protein
MVGADGAVYPQVGFLLLLLLLLLLTKEPLNAIVPKKASSHLLVFTRDTCQKGTEKSTGQAHLLNI